MSHVIPLQPAEQITILPNISWETFDHLLQDMGNQRGQRLTYTGGILEIMSPLGEHEHDNRFIESLIGVLADELNIPIKRLGSLTLKSPELGIGVEPDSCYYIAREPSVRNKQHIDLSVDPPPDLVLEIDISNHSLNKLPLYASLKIPEIWRYNGKELMVFHLQGDNSSYEKRASSSILPRMEIAKIPYWIARSLETGETATLRQFRTWLRNSGAPQQESP